MRRLLDRFRTDRNSPWNDIQPIRAELFGGDRFRDHAHHLARAQTITTQPIAVYSVVQRLHDNSQTLLAAYRELCSTVSEGKAITPAAEWLIDNYHLIEKHIAQTAADLPRGYYRQLPKIAEGVLAGHPQIFGIAWAYVAHTDSRFDAGPLTDFVNAYQEVRALTIGELWATSISLRLVLLENAARISARTVAARRAREDADGLADALQRPGSDARAKIDSDHLYLPEHVRLSFAVQLIKRLRDYDAGDRDRLEWLANLVRSLGHDFESAVAEEHHRQAAANVTMRNLVTSLRFISDHDWDQWFDGVSLVDRLLRASPQYGAMDARSRNDYRSAIEDLAHHSWHDEFEVARLAVERAAAASGDGPAALQDAGYYLIGRGRAAFEKQIGYRPPPVRRIADLTRAAGLPGYAGGIILGTAAMLWLGLWPLLGTGLPLPLIVALTVFGAGPAFEAGMALANYALTQVLRPVLLPGLSLRDGIPPELRTLVAIPVLLTSAEDIEALLERLEVHYLSNNAGESYFALLTDWTDAPRASAPEDEALLGAAMDGIATLNARYPGNKFLLLHRARRWNKQQRAWMGWERKRGKLAELNRLLRGHSDTSYMVIAGRLPDAVKYVVTLDADTRLPRDAARRLVGKIAHPLNRPHADATSGRVVEGYGILQPRVTPSLPQDGSSTLFQRIYSLRRGIDPYVFAVSDVYQDLFGEGTFAGKGIYDVDAFETALAGRVPENTMLSHDLFEGILARAALVSDVEVMEEYPERYAVAAARHHRWTRGDWQLLPWIAGQRRGTVTALGRWKMTDNLRRSLTPVLVLAALLAGWLYLPGAAAASWTLFVVLVIFIPAMLPIFAGAHLSPMAVPVSSEVRAFAEDCRKALRLTLANLVLLAHQAGLAADAILRTLYRLAVRRDLLEWTTAQQVELQKHPGLGGTYLTMATSVAAGVLALAIAVARRDEAVPVIALFAAAWLAAPAFAWKASMAQRPETEFAASEAQRQALRQVARRTWGFFETFVTAADNHLPPDNFQEDPKPVVAHRTSPTNIGLYLLSVASAREFGWIGLATAAGRLDATLSTIEKMETCRGHLYNWYDTETLVPLYPKYVSTVDSGNLAGHLIAVANFCTAWSAEPSGHESRLPGIDDAAGLLRGSIAALTAKNRTVRSLRRAANETLDALARNVDTIRAQPELLAVRLVSLAVNANAVGDIVSRIAAECTPEEISAAQRYAGLLKATIEHQFQDATGEPDQLTAVRAKLNSIAARARQLAFGMDFGFLLDRQRHLLAIGYRVDEATADENCYDMLASEAALASYFAIAKGDVEARHWFRLARPVTSFRGKPALVSWSGSMFEYLMPSLVLEAPRGSLLATTSEVIVLRQVDYGKSLGSPWGISESAFAARDLNYTYQYSNFGVPGLGLKRGLADNTVIAPYATGLAAMYAPRLAADNYEALEKAGGLGSHGYYEAVDYTPSRLRSGESCSVVKAYFAHHQGMTIVAILNAVKDGIARLRFHSEAMVRATELMLQERPPRYLPAPMASIAAGAAEQPDREVLATAPRQSDPRVSAGLDTHLLSNGQLTTMITATGSGYISFNGIMVNRWEEDAAGDSWGMPLFIRDMRDNAVWTAGYMPQISQPANYAAEFSEEKATIHRSDAGIATTLECVVSAEANSEVRRLSIVNNSRRTRTLEVTSYTELALAAPAADSAHPAFSKMFVVTEYLPEWEILLATRHKRLDSDPDIWVAQFMLVRGHNLGHSEIETDRARFLGRGRSIARPAAVFDGVPLSGSTGAVLDPAFVIRRRLRIAAGQQAAVTLWTVAAASREEVLELADRHRQEAAYERAQILAWTHGRVQLRHLSITAAEAQHYQQLAGFLIYPSPALRGPASMIASGLRSQPALWSMGISGDRPILLLRIDSAEDVGIVRDLVAAQEYWNAKQFAADVAILNERRTSYLQELQGTIEDIVRRSQARHGGGVGPARIHVLRGDLLPAESVAMLKAAARVTLRAASGGLAAQLARLRLPPPAAAASPAPQSMTRRPLPAPADTGLALFNGYGGFDLKRNEYVVVHRPDKPLPAPWINVIANPDFGVHCAADGGGYCWSGNSREYQITAWSNDPVSNRPGECFYVQDRQSGRLTGPCVAPLRHGRGRYRTRHGFGYTVFEADDSGLHMELLQVVAADDPVRVARLTVSCDGTAPRELTLSYFAEPVLGLRRSLSAPHVVSAMDDSSGALFLRNPWSPETAGRIVFVRIIEGQTGWTASREEFLGRFGSLMAPRALADRANLGQWSGAGADPCMALQRNVTVSPRASATMTVLMGAATSEAAAREMVAKYRGIDCNQLLAEVQRRWERDLGAVKVETPDPSFDVMLNGWLLYQTMACRLWSRSGFYQASGAYGFRDQLQDTMAVATARPDLARAHLLRAAARQFAEGDVQHWWLPETGAGVRTRISDDLLWLAYCTAHYVKVTGDSAVLDEPVAFIEGRQLDRDEHDAFYIPAVAEKTAPLYEHCALAIERGLTSGPHGLPLIGTGDWNDGMNRVGQDGRGESVWLGWFLHATLAAFEPLAEARGDRQRCDAWAAARAKLGQALEAHGWDGKWYRRGYFDDGTPLGSSQRPECRIDAIAQSWAVISAAAPRERAAQAMDQAYRQLADGKLGIVKLFTPPFDQSLPDPGYVKSYPPGIRENGGQYTHGAAWSIFAHAALGEADRAWQIFGYLNPLTHSQTEADCERYRVEPYAVAADIYSEPPHAGRGGWTWYTGAAGWLYRAGLEALLGITREGSRLRIKPCVPEGWNDYKVTLRFKSLTHTFIMKRGAGAPPQGVTRDASGAWIVDLETLKADSTMVLGLD